MFVALKFTNMKKNYSQIVMKQKTASSYARFFKSSILKCSKTLLAFLFTLFFAGNSFAQAGDFVTRWNLANTGASTTGLTFGTVTGGSVSYSWTEVGGSGSGSGTFSGTSLNITSLPSGKTIELRISPSNFQRININNTGDKLRLTDVKQWGTTAWTSMANAFFGCENLNITATDIPNLAGVTSMNSMFQTCKNLSTVPNINSWNTSNVNAMNSTFNNCSKFNENIGSWNTANVTNMSSMFRSASAFNQNIGSWNTAKVTTMQQMFNLAGAFNQDISGWNTGSVNNMSSMFDYASAFNQNIGNWSTGGVTTMQKMFENASAFNQNLGNWRLRASVTMTDMLKNSNLNCTNYSSTLIGWNSQSVTGIILGATGRTYSFNLAARANLALAISSGGKGWNITDGGVGNCNDPRLTITRNTGLYDYQGVRVASDAVDTTWKVTSSRNISNASLTFTWTNSSPNILTGFDRNTLGVYTRTSGYTGSGDWTLVYTGKATLVSGSIYRTTVTGLTLDSTTNYYFGVTNSITPLPVSIIDFKGFVKNDVINLNWKVTDEKELSRYDIYSSVDGVNYSVCGSVSATVSETGIKTYQFQDLSNKSALVYYKINAINNDETGEWTSIVALHTVKPVTSKPLKVYPNPATDFINLEFDGIVPSYFNVLIMDMSGKVVYQLDGVETESNQYTLPLNGIESGMYIVKLSDEFGNTTINRFSIK
jgi:surface protein